MIPGQHTPAPWAYDRETRAIVGAAGQARPLIASVILDCVTEERGDADGNLLAAAPEFDIAADLAIPLLQEDRDAIFECHTLAGDPTTLTSAEAHTVAKYDTALFALRAAQAKARGEDAPDELPFGQCPFDNRLARTPYLVIPKLALQAMPMLFRLRFEAMLAEMDAAGIETPDYQVLRDDGPGGRYTRATVVNEATGYVRIMGGEPDPWADYRHTQREKVAALCPGFKA